MKTLIGTLAVLLFVVSPALAAINIDVGDHIIYADLPDQIVQIYVTGDEDVQALIAYLQVANGGPEAEPWLGGETGIDGPVITALDIITGTIFDGNNMGQFGDDDNDPDTGEDLVPQYEAGETITASGTVVATGLLVTLTLDTTGFLEGTWDLRMADTITGDSSFPYSDPPTITNGSITLVPIPEPAVVLQLLTGLAGLGLVATWRRRLR